MVLTSLIISIISLVIALISLLGFVILLNSIINQNFRQNIQNSNISNEETPVYQDGYKVGSSSVWGAVQLAVYDMFREADIFDYEGTMENLTSKVSKVITDDNFRENLHKELDEYMKRESGGE